MNVGATIRAARESRGITAVQLAELLGVSDQTVLRWERGLHEPDAWRLQAIADALGMRLAVSVELAPLPSKELRAHYASTFGGADTVGVQLLARAIYRVRYPGAGEDRTAVAELTRGLLAEHGEAVTGEVAVAMIEDA